MIFLDFYHSQKFQMGGSTDRSANYGPGAKSAHHNFLNTYELRIVFTFLRIVERENQKNSNIPRTIEVI